MVVITVMEGGGYGNEQALFQVGMTMTDNNQSMCC